MNTVKETVPRYSDECGVYVGPFSAGNYEIGLIDVYTELCGRLKEPGRVAEAVQSCATRMTKITGVKLIEPIDDEHSFAVHLTNDEGGEVAFHFPKVVGRVPKAKILIFFRGPVGENDLNNFLHGVGSCLRTANQTVRSAD